MPARLAEIAPIARAAKARTRIRISFGTGGCDRLHFRLGIEIGIGSAGRIPPGGGRLTLLIGREAAIAGAAGEIAALDAVGKAVCRGRRRRDRRCGAGRHQCQQYASHVRSVPVLAESFNPQPDNPRVPASNHVRALRARRRAHGRRRAHVTVASVPGGARRRRQHAAGKGPIGGGRSVVSLADIIGICDAIQICARRRSPDIARSL